jgi:hypothetical protein
MTLAIPNTFTNGTAIDAAQIEANNGAIKKQINGGIIAADISATAGIDQQHIMNGEYLPTNIDYDMTSGHEVGAQELPSMLVGALTKYFGNLSVSPKSIPRTGTTFYMKKAGDVFIRFDVAVKGYESETVAPFNAATAQIFIAVDDNFYSSTKFVFEEENDWGGSFVGGLFPGWEKRRSYGGHFVVNNLAAGEHTICLVGHCGSQAFFLKALSFTIEAHYD